MAKNIDVIETFVKGGTKGKTQNLSIGTDYGTHTDLINYNTVIAERYDVGGQIAFIINETKYSRSTSTIQNALKRVLDSEGYDYSIVTGVQIGAKTL